MSCANLVEDVGELIMFIGPMFSSKTTHLLAELTTCADLNHSVLYINHSSDIRNTEQQDAYITTHHSSFRKLSEKITQVKVNRLEEIPYDISAYDVIGIDESQFFPNINAIVRDWVINKNKTVYLAGLNGDFRMMPIGEIHLLYSLASCIKLLTAKCEMCKAKITGSKRPLMIDAHFTGKIGGDKNKIVEIGGENLYKPLCMACHKANMYETTETVSKPIPIPIHIPSAKKYAYPIYD